MINSKSKVSLPVRSAFAIFAACLAGGKFVRAQDVFGTKIPGADAIGTSKNSGSFLLAQRWHSAAELERFVGFAEGNTNVAGQRIVTGHALVGSFQDDDVFLSA